ncbi:MAG TPA: prepilin-type N-terminal cleavage/methylation domain-containing protein [Steroidobacteraceae bacterium]|nr:prepilin-type N-terminal cleavage/methylation domain-containing protein [Steroidobacteraceae bacterium]
MNAAPHRAAFEPRAGRRAAAGFSLVEVLVALVIASIGLLGLAKMESLGIASTNIAGTRSLAAIEAASLAAMMHADRAYWAGGFAPASFTVNGGGNGTIAISNSGLAAAYNCTIAGSSSCAPASLAAYDVQNWAADLNRVLPPYLATVTCSTTGFPVSCAIEVQWTESGVAANALQTNMAALNAPTYILYVEP